MRPFKEPIIMCQVVDRALSARTVAAGAGGVQSGPSLLRAHESRKPGGGWCLTFAFTFL